MENTEPKTRRPGRGYQGKIESLTARMAVALVLVDQLRPALRTNHTMELADKITETLTLPARIGTPAEARTGISDRTAAALSAVDDLRREVGRCVNNGTMGPGYRSHLDIIEQALRHE